MCVLICVLMKQDIHHKCKMHVLTLCVLLLISAGATGEQGIHGKRSAGTITLAHSSTHSLQTHTHTHCLRRSLCLQVRQVHKEFMASAAAVVPGADMEAVNRALPGLLYVDGQCLYGGKVCGCVID